jgi:DNA-binding MarR family transcriptional regulator
MMPDLTSPARLTFDRLVHVETMLWNRLDDNLRQRVGLPLARLEVLRVIAHTECCRVNEVASGLLITVGAASKLVDRLEASGHCARQPNPDDRRSSLLNVTALGRTTLTQAEALLEPLLDRAFASVQLPHLDAALAQVERTLLSPGELR